jgi:hypothetical protein
MIFPAGNPHDHGEYHLGRMSAVVSDNKVILVIPE